MSDRIVTAAGSSEEEAVDRAIRPKKLADYVGQEQVKAQLEIFVKAAVQRGEALDHALQYGRDLDRGQADTFVGMYVNDWTLDFGPRGREAVTQLLAHGYQAGVVPKLVVPEFVEI